MTRSIRELIKSALSAETVGRLKTVKSLLIDDYYYRSYSQEGEDMILRRIFEQQKTGFYVDVGAHHPKRFSNTYFFYQQGWRGINIDAMPGSMKIFEKLRPRDINIEKPVSDKHEKLVYHIFAEPALNTFSKSLADSYIAGKFPLKTTVELETATLEEILSANMPAGQIIDFMSVDVEGYDLNVLQSNDWTRFAPRFLLIEMLGLSVEEILRCEIMKYLSVYGYTMRAKCENTVILARQLDENKAKE
jgi:FkbM family methyltransferase